MQEKRRDRSAAFALALCALAALLVAGFAGRGAEAGKDKAKAKAAKAHLEYRSTYEAALLEARIRNLPTFVSRHKDF